MTDIIFAILFLVLFSKWIFIVLVFPFMSINNRRGESKIRFVLSLPYLVVEHFARGGIVRYVLINIGYIPSLHVRKVMYKLLGADIGPKVIFHFKTEIRCPQKLKVGKGTIIGDNALLDARCGLTFGENVNLSSNVSIYTLQHDHRDPYFACNEDRRKMSVEIGDRAWLGSNVIVLPGVHIGEGAVCCAGCVVTKDIEPYAIVAGIPAKKIGERTRDLRYEFNGKSCRFY